MKVSGILFGLLLFPVSSYAVDVFLQGGVHVGGDEMVTATFTNGDTEKIKGGELISLLAGVGTGVAEDLEARLMLGVKFDTIDAENGSVDFFRYPLEALLMYKAAEKVYLGGGLAYHLNPNISGDGIATGANVDFDNALGLALQLDYILSNGGYLAVKLTSIDYEAFGQSVSGNSIGALLGFRF